MIADIRTLPDGSTVSADLVIIGGGMAGVALAREWAGADKTVLIVESGDREHADETQALYAGAARLADDAGAERAIDDYLTESRVRRYGGSSHWWGGKCAPLDPADFAPRAWVKHSGWPMTREDLQPYYDRACDALSIPRFDKDYNETQHEGRPPLRINGARHIETLPRDYSPVTSYAGTPHFEEFLYGFTGADNISVYLNANAVDVHLSDDRARLNSIGVATLDGKRYTARGSAFVLACGGIENARLLLAANARNSARFGERSNALGRFFQGHTVVFKERGEDGSGTFLHVTAPSESLSLYTDRGLEAPHAVLGATLAGQETYQAPAFTVTFELESNAAAAADESVLRTMATKVDQGDLAAAGDQSHWCYYMSENHPNPQSRITLTDETDALGIPKINLRWEYGADDLDGFEHSFNAFVRELGISGTGRASCPIERDNLINAMMPSRHHIGTTRMHENPSIGVVDPDLRCHDTENLYIAGSSVFPTSGIANPTLTIIALALRLSDHLKQKLGG